MLSPIVQQLPLFDDRPLPLLVAEKWTFELDSKVYVTIRYYNIRQWLHGLFKDKKYANQAIRNFRRNGALFDEYVREIHTFPERDSRNRVQAVEYGTDKLLYMIVQNVYEGTARGKRDMSLVNAIKEYLAEAGAFADLTRRDPQQAQIAIQDYERQKERSKLINEGYTSAEADEWLSMRQQQQVTHHRITSEWQARGAKGREFGRLTNDVTEVATGKTATKLKKEMGITESPRQYLSTAQNAAIQIVESLSTVFHVSRQSHGVEELSGDIHDVKPIIDAALPEIGQALSKKPRRLKGQDQPKLLED